jgi:hypothetical protein
MAVPEWKNLENLTLKFFAVDFLVFGLKLVDNEIDYHFISKLGLEPHSSHDRTPRKKIALNTRKMTFSPQFSATCTQKYTEEKKTVFTYRIVNAIFRLSESHYIIS